MVSTTNSTQQPVMISTTCVDGDKRVVTTSPNQTTIAVYKQNEVAYRILIEDIDINDQKKPLQLSEKEIEELTYANEKTLRSFADDKRLLIVKVDYATDEIFRAGDQYKAFMCDVPLKERMAIEEKMETLTIFTKEEVQACTKGCFWEHIDAVCKGKEEYDSLALRALKTFKEGHIEVFELSAILLYCNYKSDIENGINITLTTGQDLRDKCSEKKERSLPLELVEHLEDEDLCIAKIEKQDFLGSGAQVFHPRLLWKSLCHASKSRVGIPDEIKKNPMLPRPAAGHSHRNRFATSVMRPYVVPVPGITLPNNIHGIPCDAWIMDSQHDQGHLLLESGHPYRDAQVAFAAIVYAYNKNDDLYNRFLDRLVCPYNCDSVDRAVKELMPRTVHRNSSPILSELAEALKEWFKDPSQEIVISESDGESDGGSDIFYTPKETISS